MWLSEGVASNVVVNVPLWVANAVFTHPWVALAVTHGGGRVLTINVTVAV